MDRTEQIRNAARRRDAAIVDEVARKEMYRRKLVNAVEDLGDRIREMARVAGTLIENGFRLGRTYGWPHIRVRDAAGRWEDVGVYTENVTDGINHRPGFFVRKPYNTGSLADYTLTGFYGIENGGSFGPVDLKIEISTGKITSGDNLILSMERFLEEFDEEEFDDAEKMFYEYVDSL